MTDQQVNDTIELAKKTVDVVSKDNKRWFITAIAVSLCFLFEICWMCFWYFNSDYGAPQTQIQNQSSNVINTKGENK